MSDDDHNGVAVTAHVPSEALGDLAIRVAHSGVPLGRWIGEAVCKRLYGELWQWPNAGQGGRRDAQNNKAPDC